MPTLINTIFGVLLATATVPSAYSASPTQLHRIGTEQSYDLDVPGGISRSDQVTDTLANYIAVFFARFDLPFGDSVVVRSPDRRISYEYRGLGRGAYGNLGGFYSGRIPGAQATIEYKASPQSLSPTPRQNSSPNSTFGYRVSKYVRGVADLKRTESVCGAEDMTKPAKCFTNSSVDPLLHLAYEKAKSVARLFINSTFFCTGWLIGSEGHMLTSNHCIATPAQAATVDVEFDAESNSCEEECRTSLGCAGKIVAASLEFIAGNDKLDYTLLKVAENVTSKYKYLQVRQTGPVLGERIYIPQYPNGWAKRISSSLSDGQPAKIQTLGGTTACGKNQVGYAADTSQGSSGSPLISATDNAVVALHHCGGCENTAVNVMDIIKDVAIKNIMVKDFFAPAATPDEAQIPNVTDSAASTPSPPPSSTSGPTSTPTSIAVSPTNAPASTLTPNLVKNLTLVPYSTTNASSVSTPTQVPTSTVNASVSAANTINSEIPPISPLVQKSDGNASLCTTLTVGILCKYTFWCEWDPKNEKCNGSQLYQWLSKNSAL